jgi:EF-P beta-lysylation protein EpmB
VEQWQSLLKTNITSWETLVDFLQLLEVERSSVLKKSHFPLNLPRRLANKIRKGTLNDPLFRQFVPLTDENSATPGFNKDPVNESTFFKSEKLLQKYEGRALLVSTGACAMNCRFCFRRSFPYEKERKKWDKELTILKNDPTITEVIVSGGDPLSLPNASLKELFDQLDTIDHLERIRLHSRFPLAFPERINTEFLEILKRSKKQIVFVLHSNHPREFDEEIFTSLKEMSKIGVLLLNQSVLLRGVNDSVETLKELFLLLINNGVLPYYLHQLDRVEGAAHFEVSQQEGLQLMSELANLLPGYALPKYVQEIPGKGAKTLINASKSSAYS